MATRKTSSKAKSKPAARAKATAAKTKATKTATPKTLVSRLSTLQLVSGLVFVLLAVTAGLLMNHSTYQLFVGLLTKDELASKAGTFFVPAVHSVFDLELRWAVVVILGLAAVTPLLAATFKRAQYQASLKKKVMAWRWVDMAITSALMVEVVALLSGVQDILVLKMIAGLMVITCVLGWLAEKHNAQNKGTGRGAYVVSLFTGFLPWLLIAGYAVSTVVYGLVRSPWYVYALYAALLGCFLLVAANLRKSLKGTGRSANYEYVERNYTVLNFLAKSSFAVILILGLKK